MQDGGRLAGESLAGRARRVGAVHLEKPLADRVPDQILGSLAAALGRFRDGRRSVARQEDFDLDHLFVVHGHFSSRIAAAMA